MTATRATVLGGAAGALLLAAGCSGTQERRAELPPLPPAPAIGAPAAPGYGTPPGLPGGMAGTPVAGGLGGPVGGPPATAGCDAGAAQGVVGRLGNVAASDEAKSLSGAASVRVLYPNQPITQEFIGTRLNLETNDENIVVRVRCG
ncbi:I78 family peptidase inhibitor [Aurantimonas sp. Leaf443]|uniref:I78 family peptidase inhibitor n=1 Tax=Aurantimonas sp. Leaf443 TaxID=1736378 RepID=UPI0006FB9B32|nr:I78 family peptidase inhibitor [Aurantimonas sp. Leaf443]KQT82158.1 hypothetical protein ASG48_16060 [Aurantimonas sp. Leaf443]